LVPTALLLFVGIWLLFVLLAPQAADLNGKVVVAVASLTSFGALAVAIIPKLRWGFANTGLHDRTPITFIFGAGVCATLFSVGINLVAGALFLHGLSGAMRQLDWSLPWLAGTFATAATIAWLIQDNRWQGVCEPLNRRARDALVLGLLWLLVSALGEIILVASGKRVLVPMHLLYTALGSGIFGAVVGYAIPEFVRYQPATASTPPMSFTVPIHASPITPQTMDS
jgi:hypothetical protein